MIQIVNITDARNNLAKLVQKVKATKKPIVIVQDSTPSVVIYPYDELVTKEEKRNNFFNYVFNKSLQKEKKSLKVILRKITYKIPLQKMRFTHS